MNDKNEKVELIMLTSLYFIDNYHEQKLINFMYNLRHNNKTLLDNFENKVLFEMFNCNDNDFKLLYDILIVLYNYKYVVTK